MAHTCPIDRCPEKVPDHLLMCRKHWRQVPRDLQREVYAAYDRGRGLGSDRHTAARQAAVHAVEAG